ncbi:MAG: hypothetical protein WBE82_01655, partial [Xanthobacteraceae bacterium]
ADLSVARPAPAGADMKHCVCRRSASFFSFSSFLICHCRHSRSKNGVTSFAYDPAIHGALWLVQPRRKGSRHVSMDHRVKPSGDEENASLFEIAISISESEPTHAASFALNMKTTFGASP